MAKVFIEEETLTAIGAAIREKEGSSELVPVNDMATRISAIETGGGGELPEEAFLITGDCSYQFFAGRFSWLVNTHGNKLKTENITRLYYFMRDNTMITEIPFTINVNGVASAEGAFSGMIALKTCPRIRGTLAKPSTSFTMSSMLEKCEKVADFEDLFDSETLGDGFNNFKVTSSSSVPKPPKFSGCHSLRRVPSWVGKFKHSSESTAAPNSNYIIYNYMFNNCYMLDEITDYSVLSYVAPVTNNMFTYFVDNACCLKKLTFEIDSGQPKVVSWKSQTLDLSKAGVETIYGVVTKYGGIPSSKKVTDDTTYQALKNDPDWWTADVAYSRYNHDSAVETVNSLPDTSAYLASAGGTNTIKFKGEAGSKTDGGAINTLTAEEIAVATAKGWTVTLS